MGKYPVKPPPEGFMVEDAPDGRYYPLRSVPTGWEYILGAKGARVSYAKRWQAVGFCERLAGRKGDKGERPASDADE